MEIDKITWVKVPYKDGYITVSSDYVSVDGIRRPMGYAQALAVAEAHGARLPTQREVDAIYQAADMKLEPKPMTPGPQMSSVAYYEKHNDIIEDQIDGDKFRLVAGHKKDIIPQQRAGRVTIYGWHKLNGKPIQPVSSVHGADYYDYSHGVRLVKC